MNSVMPHPDSEALVRLIDGDLDSAESTAVGSHLLGCEECRTRLQSLREAVDDYGRFHREVLIPSFPPAPREWGRLEFPKIKRDRQWPAPWLAAAAAIAALVFLWSRFDRTPAVRAAELLRKAVAAEQASLPPGARARIRIRSRSHTLDRAASLAAQAPVPESADAAELHSMFDAAGYGWENPLSVTTFSRWRDGLRQRQDQVDETAGALLVRTSTPAGALLSAVLTLRATDLHAVACTLHFRSGGETIDLTELPDDAPNAPNAPASAPPPTPLAAFSKPAGADDELHLVAALHGIGADLGEPVEIQRAGATVQVRVVGVDENRRNQFRAALSAIPVAQLIFEDVRENDPRAPLSPPRAVIPADRINPLIADLRAQLGSNMSINDLSDQLIDAIDKAAERAFALRALARRFPFEATAQFSPSDADILSGILRDHSGALASAIREIRRLLAPILPSFVLPAPAPAPRATPNGARWQTLVEALPPAVEKLDRTINGATDASDARKTQLAGTVAEFDQLVSTLRSMVRP